MTNQVLQSFYEGKYAEESAAGQTIKPLEVGRVVTDRLRAAVHFFPQHFKGGDVLEIGAGRGEIAATLLHSQADIKSYTISDLSQNRVAGVKATLGDPRIEAIQLDVENEDTFPAGKTYDAVIMVALIEHLVDPISALSNISRRINPGGFIYIDTPNIAKYTQRLKLMAGRFPSTASVQEGLVTFDGKPTSLFDEGHLHYFTYKSLSRLAVERCGFSRITKLAYPGGRRILGDVIHGRLATFWPEMFSELTIIAHRD